MRIDSDDVLSIVKKWKISRKSEYSSFRCTLCQKPMRKARHVWLKKSECNLEVHFCNKFIAKVEKQKQ